MINRNFICIIGGAGHVGAPLGLALSSKGYNVTLIDKNQKNIKKINNGIMPFVEDGCAKLLKKMIYKKTNKMNRLNVLTAITSNFKIEFNVSKNVFFPKPKVDSSVIKLTHKNSPNYNFSKLENFTRILFRYKRKKLHNVLPNEILNILKLKNNSFNLNDILNSRAEDLTLNNIIIIFKRHTTT